MQRDSNLKSHPGNDEKTLERKKNDSMCPLFVRKVVSPMKTPYILAPDTCDVTFISSGEEDFVKETKRKSPRKTPKTSQSSSDLKQFSPNTVRDGVSLKPSLALNKKSKPNAELDLDETRLDCYGEMDASLFNDDGDDELLKGIYGLKPVSVKSKSFLNSILILKYDNVYTSIISYKLIG